MMDQMKEGAKCMNCDGGSCGCKCMHHKVGPVIVTLFGALFLAGNAGWVSMETVQWGWPSLITAAGLSKLASRWCKCC